MHHSHANTTRLGGASINDFLKHVDTPLNVIDLLDVFAVRNVLSDTLPTISDSTWPPKIAICTGAVVLHEARVLFIRERRQPSVWSIPWGFVEGKNLDGTLDPPEFAASRETKEEALVGAEIVGLLGLQNHASASGEPRLYFLFLCRPVRGEPTSDGVETDRAQDRSLDDILTWREPIDPFVRWVVLPVLAGEHMRIQPRADTPCLSFTGFF